MATKTNSLPDELPAVPTFDTVCARLSLPIEAEETLADAALKPNASWPSGTVQWVDKDGQPVKEEDLTLGTDTKLVEDYKGNKLLLFSSFWSIKWVSDHNPQLVLTEFNERSEEDT